MIRFWGSWKHVVESLNCNQRVYLLACCNNPASLSHLIVIFYEDFICTTPEHRFRREKRKDLGLMHTVASDDPQ